MPTIRANCIQNTTTTPLKMSCVPMCPAHLSMCPQPPGGIPHRANVAGAVGTSRINVSSSQAVTCEDCRRTSSLIRTGTRAQEAIGVGELAAKFEESS